MAIHNYINPVLFVILIIIAQSSCDTKSKSTQDHAKKKTVYADFNNNYKLGFINIQEYRESKDSVAKKKLLETAVFYLEKAHLLDTNNMDALHLLANSYYLSKNYKRSIELFEKCEAKKPGDPKILKNLHRSYREMGKQYFFLDNNPLWAKRVLEKALQIDDKDPATLEMMGVVESGMGNWKEGIAYYKKAIALDPKAASTWVNLSVTYSKKGEDDKAVAALKKAQEIDPKATNPLLH
ncbi:MAG: tetratricopeptide repeat protein [Bacteroidota bacterium]|nr:tetratricopeptide repeat protein [Bacteroidota bacterium]